QFDKAAVYYEKHLSNQAGDLEAQMLLLETYSQSHQYEKLEKRSDMLLESYPLQPDFYYYAGLAKNQLKQHKKAIDVLEMGIDYVIDNKALLAQFTFRLVKAGTLWAIRPKRKSTFALPNS